MDRSKFLDGMTKPAHRILQRLDPLFATGVAAGQLKATAAVRVVLIVALPSSEIGRGWWRRVAVAWPTAS
jgi:hypothetical protein